MGLGRGLGWLGLFERGGAVCCCAAVAAVDFLLACFCPIQLLLLPWTLRAVVLAWAHVFYCCMAVCLAFTPPACG